MTSSESTAAPHAPEQIRALSVLADDQCGLCRRLADWLQHEPQLVPLEIIPAGSALARQRFPGLDHERTLREITVVADTGHFWHGGAAWVICLWALTDYRGRAMQLSTPAGFAAAKTIAQTASLLRARTSAPGRMTAPSPVELTGSSYGECHDRRCG